MSRDLLSDGLTIIRNGQSASKKSVEMPYSTTLFSLLSVLKDNGYILDVQSKGDKIKTIIVSLKYYKGVPVIDTIKRVSKPGKRVYVRSSEMQKYYNGLGISIITTSKGVLSDREAVEAGVGGEILCSVF